MAFEAPFVLNLTKIAAVDMSDWQYRFVKLDTNGQIVKVAADTDSPCGVLQNTPKAGWEATVTVIGVTKVSADAAVLINAWVGTSGDGQGVTRVAGDTTKAVLGQAQTAAGGANELFPVLVNCLLPRGGGGTII